MKGKQLWAPRFVIGIFVEERCEVTDINASSLALSLAGALNMSPFQREKSKTNHIYVDVPARFGIIGKEA